MNGAGDSKVKQRMYALSRTQGGGVALASYGFLPVPPASAVPTFCDEIPRKLFSGSWQTPKFPKFDSFSLERH